MPKAPTKIRARDRWLLLLLALPFLATGIYLVGIGLHWIHVDPAKVHAPGWVIALCGLVPLSAGFAFLDFMRRNSNPGRMILVVNLVALGVVTHWVAFGEGERNFTRTRSINGVVLESGPIDELTGRKAFGIGAVLLDVLIVTLAGLAIRKRFSHSRPSASND